MSRDWGVILYAFREFVWNNDNLKPSEKLLFIFICENQSYCSKSLNTISKATGLNRKTIISALKTLKDLGLVTIQQFHRKPSVITPTIPKVLSTKNGTLNDDKKVLSTENGTLLVPKTVRNIYRKRYSNYISNYKNNYQDDFCENEECSGDGLKKELEKLDATSLLDAVMKKTIT